MKKLFILVSVILSLHKLCYSQIFYPDGKRVHTSLTSMGAILDSLGFKETQMFHHPKLDYTIYFKRLTNTPVLVFLLGPNSSKIKSLISLYTPEYKKYINSYSYYWDLKDMIKKGTLTKNYLLDAFNQPDVKGHDGDAEYWMYKNYNVKIIFDDSVGKSVDVVNYEAIEKNELSIPSFAVTGSDYTIGFDISLSNYSKKTIKYSFITVTVTNAVDDKIATKTLKAVGPIRPDETGTYQFEDILFSKVAHYISIDQIKLQFMDGSIKYISSKDEIKKIRIMDWEEVGNRTLDD